MEARYTIYAVENTDFVIQPFAITAATSTHGGVIQGEWFLARPDDSDKGVVFQTTRITLNDFNSYSTNGSIETFTDFELKGQVELALRVSEISKSHSHEEPRRYPRLSEQKNDFLLHYALRGQAKDHLEWIESKTICPPLMTYLHWLRGITPLTWSGSSMQRL